MVTLTLISRAYCHLCHDMEQALVSLAAKPVLLQYFEDTLSAEDRAKLTVVSPDTGRVRVADQ